MTNPNIDEIRMPENLALAMKVMQFRMKCAEMGCTYDYAHYPPKFPKIWSEP